MTIINSSGGWGELSIKWWREFRNIIISLLKIWILTIHIVYFSVSFHDQMPCILKLRFGQKCLCQLIVLKYVFLYTFNIKQWVRIVVPSYLKKIFLCSRKTWSLLWKLYCLPCQKMDSANVWNTLQHRRSLKGT